MAVNSLAIILLLCFSSVMSVKFTYLGQCYSATVCWYVDFQDGRGTDIALLTVSYDDDNQYYGNLMKLGSFCNAHGQANDPNGRIKMMIGGAGDVVVYYINMEADNLSPYVPEHFQYSVAYSPDGRSQRQIENHLENKKRQTIDAGCNGLGFRLKLQPFYTPSFQARFPSMTAVVTLINEAAAFSGSALPSLMTCPHHVEVMEPKPIDFNVTLFGFFPPGDNQPILINTSTLLTNTLSGLDPKPDAVILLTDSQVLAPAVGYFDTVCGQKLEEKLAIVPHPPPSLPANLTLSNIQSTMLQSIGLLLGIPSDALSNGTDRTSADGTNCNTGATFMGTSGQFEMWSKCSNEAIAQQAQSPYCLEQITSAQCVPILPICDSLSGSCGAGIVAECCSQCKKPNCTITALIPFCSSLIPSCASSPHVRACCDCPVTTTTTTAAPTTTTTTAPPTTTTDECIGVLPACPGLIASCETVSIVKKCCSQCQTNTTTTTTTAADTTTTTTAADTTTTTTAADTTTTSTTATEDTTTTSTTTTEETTTTSTTTTEDTTTTTTTTTEASTTTTTAGPFVTTTHGPMTNCHPSCPNYKAYCPFNISIRQCCQATCN